MPRLPYGWTTLIAATSLLVGGCGGAGNQGANAPDVAQNPARTQKPVESVTPNVKIDLDKADPIVKGEVKGGEFDKGPTDLSHLYQDPDEKAIQDEPYEVTVPAGLPDVASFIPVANLMTRGKLELGRQLYFDQRISLDATISCASCHDPAKGWADGMKTSAGIKGQKGGRNAPTVLNTVYGQTMFWDGRAPSLEGQAQGPIQNKIEMGDQSYKQIVDRLRAIPGYREQFMKVFGTDVTLDGMAKAIACFERTALSGNSAYDRYTAINPDADKFKPEDYQVLTESQKRGMVLFGYALKEDDPYKVDSALLRKANCTKCHAGQNFTDEQFHNIGVGYDTKAGKLADRGRFEVVPIGAKSKAQIGSFKTPTIRDITRTAPYMHDGSEKTLAQVIDYYNKGGNPNPTLDLEMKPLNLTDTEKADLVDFMKALTSPDVVVALPTLPPGPDGKSPNPQDALSVARTKNNDPQALHSLALGR